MLSSIDVALLTVFHVSGVLKTKEKKKLKQWRSLSPENESLFQEMIDPAFRKASWEEAEARHNEYIRVRDISLQKLKEKYPDTWKPKKVKKLHGKHRVSPPLDTSDLAKSIKKK